MESTLTKRVTFLTIGFAIFSMFFGAGNSIFPLEIGSLAASKNIYAILGLVISTILVPILGLYAIVLYDGDYKKFFYSLGRAPGFLIISMIMILIGPFAGIPRCITLSYATLKPHLGSLSLMSFSAIACLIVFFQTIKKHRLVVILGKVLTPVLLICLALIIVKGLFFGSKEMVVNHQSSAKVFGQGLIQGFQMMDLLASFFFATTVIACLKPKDSTEISAQSKRTFLKGVLLSAGLLAVIYIGFSFVAAFNSAYFQTIPKELLLGAVSHQVLGTHLGFVMALAVALACLTTSITLVSVFSDFVYQSCCDKKVPYSVCVIGTIGVTFCLSNLGFSGICDMIAPMLYVCYPSLIALTIVNILHKTVGFKYTRAPVYSVFAISLMLTTLNI